MSRLSILALAALVGGALVTSQANAAGFEKSNMWGARETGSAGIAAPYTSGSNAIYFNPAGLVTDKDGSTASANVSPTFGQFSAPISNTNEVVTSERSMTFPFGLTYGQSAGEWGFGGGVFVSGGNSVDYKEPTFGPAAGYKPFVKTSIQILEASLGAGYKVNEDLKVGLAWRVVMVNADFAFVTRVSGAPGQGIANTKLTDMSDMQGVAFRAGAQYKLNESTDLGLTFRSEVNTDPKGKAQTVVFSAASGGVLSTGAVNDATAHTTFPMMIALSALHRLAPDLDLLAQYDFAQYSRVGELVVDSATFSTTGGATRVKTEWRDQHTIRLGAEYKMDWPVRFGLIYGTAVTNPDYARPTYTAPGPGYAITLGTGKAIGGADEATSNMRVDGAIEYSAATGDVTGHQDAGAGVTAASMDQTRNGAYSSSAYTAHLAFSYMF